MILASAKTDMLNALAPANASLHTDFPGLTGASNEVTGGTYVRQSCSFGTESGGVRSMSAAMNFPVPAGVTVKWVVFRDSGGTAKALAANGGLPQEFYLDTSNGTFYSAAHGYAANQLVVVYGTTMPAGLTIGTQYYVVNPTTNTFQLSATPGGSAIVPTGQGSSDCIVSRISNDFYGSAGTHTISTATIGLPD